MLYNLTKQGIGSSNDIQEIIKRLTGFGLLTVSGILVKELITKIIRRFKQN
jgi:phenylalanine-4-hydroxylase